MENIKLLESIYELGRIQYYLEHYADKDPSLTLDELNEKGLEEEVDAFCDQLEDHAISVFTALREAKNARCLDAVISMVSLKALSYASKYKWEGKNKDLIEAILLNMEKERHPLDVISDNEVEGEDSDGGLPF